MAARPKSLRSALRSSDEDESVVELARLNEDLVSKDEVAEHGHQRLRGFLEHLDDDDAIVNDGRSNECEPPIE